MLAAAPFSTDKLTGNIATETLIGYLESQGVELGLNMDKWNEAMAFSGKIFG